MDNSLKLAVFLYLLTFFSVVLDIVVLRQIFGFFYLSFIPGYLFLKILKLDKVDHVETVLFSAGLSIAFLMFLGLLVNDVSPAFNLSKPLSTVPLMTAISGLTLILLLLGYKQKDKEAKPVSFGKANVINVLRICLLSVLPVLSIVGALYHNTSFLSLMIIGVAIICVASTFSDRLIPGKIFPLAIVLTSIALLLHTALISKYFMGYDVFNEFYVFKLTEIQGGWHAPGIVTFYSLIDTLNSILSVTGTGRYAKRFEELRDSAVGVDFSRRMIQLARGKTEAVSYIVADACHLPLKDSMFDIVVSALVVNHIENLGIFLAEMLRACRTGGELIISSVWREGVEEVQEFPEYFGKRSEFTVLEYLYPPDVLHNALTRLGASITHSGISLYTSYGEGKKGVHVVRAKKGEDHSAYKG